MDGDDVRAGEQAEQRHTSRDYFFRKLTMRHQLLYLNLLSRKNLQFCEIYIYIYLLLLAQCFKYNN
jgi:hypothetical protein